MKSLWLDLKDYYGSQITKEETKLINIISCAGPGHIQRCCLRDYKKTYNWCVAALKKQSIYYQY